MTSAFFGQFLFARRVVGAKDLFRAIEHQEVHNPKLSELAFRHGLLSRAALEKIAEEQRRTNSRFAELTIRLGLLNGWQLESLLLEQKKLHVPIGEALVAIGVLNRETLNDELRAYLAEHELESEDSQGLARTRDWARDLVYPTSVKVTSRLLLRIADLFTEEGSPLVSGSLPPAEVQVSIRFEGDWRGDYVLCVPETIARSIAGRLLGETSPPPEVVLDAVKELASVVCSQISAILDADGVSCELSAPKGAQLGASLSFPDRKILLFPLDSERGRVAVGIVQA